MSDSLIVQLMDALKVLPGVGPRSAQRMAFHLLQRNPEGGKTLSETLAQALQTVQLCTRCRMLCESDICEICISDKRDPNLLCVVQSAADQWRIEQLKQYNGYYFVLHGCLSPLERIGPDELGLPHLRSLLDTHPPQEAIVATSFTLEGETTANYLLEMFSAKGIEVTRIARGVPLGGELEYVDRNTLAQAFRDRRPL